jgi:MoaA/NifB/PqqE/SkfB family radical SAM enzyme
LIRGQIPLSSLTAVNYLTNLFRSLRGERLFKPLVVSYCVTAHCNLNCRYCEDFGARHNPSLQTDALSLTDAERVLAIIRQATDSLILTGGEPLLYPDLGALIAHARRKLRFRSLTLLTNGLLLPKHEGLLHNINRLVISLDSIDPDTWDQTLRAAPGTAQRIIDTIAVTARKQAEADFRLIIHCVITPETLPEARNVLDFCIEHDIIFSFSPQSVNNWPHYELLISDQYLAFVACLVSLKQSGAPILGSLPYLRLMLDFKPYACYPLLAPRVMPDATLAYPCHPIERGGTAHGGRAINLLDIGSWKEAVKSAARIYGLPPLACGSCYQQCYAEPSLMQAQPLAFLREMVAFSSSRRAGIHNYAPG